MMHKRILTLALAICILFNMGAAAKEFKQIAPFVENASSEAVSYDLAVEVLNSLELINRDGDPAYNQDETMTRGEFVDILVRMLELNDSITLQDQTIPFLDVNDNTPYVSSIIYAYKLGIISGGSDGRFNPEQPIKFEETLKMLITALGYSVRAERKGGYPTGYLLLAKEKEITENVDAAVGQELNKGIIAQLILNTLDVNVMQISSVTETAEEYVEIDGETMLSENLRVEKNEGIVKATEITRLTGPSALEYGNVEIGKELYKTGKTNVWDLLGYNVTYYAREIDGVPELLFAAPNSKNTVLTVNSDKIAGDDKKFTTKNFVYRDESDDKCSMAISPYAYVIYNGKALSSFTKSDLIASAGEVTLIDNDRDDKADVILVMEYSNIYVGSMAPSSKSVFDKYDLSKNVGLDPETDDYDFSLTMSGKNIEFKNIAIGSIVSYGVSKNLTGRKFVYAKVSDSKVSGSVAAKFEDGGNFYFTIDETDYMLAKDFESEYSNIGISDRGTFYLDSFGKIAAYEEAVMDNEMYGFLISYGCYSKGVKKQNEFKIFTMNSEIDVIETADKFYLDGKRIDVSDLAPSDPSAPNEVEQVLMANVDSSINGTAEEAAEYARFANYNQVIRYRLNVEGVIDKIDTIKPDNEEDSLNKYAEKGDSTRYYNSGQGALGTTKVDFMIDSNTVMLVVPDIANRDDAKNYLVSTAADYLVNGRKVTVEAYDFSADTMTVKLLVSYGVADTSSITYRTRATLVDRVVMARNEDDEFVGKLYGLSANLRIEKLAANATVLSGIKQGDIIKYGEDTQGNIVTVQKLFSPDSAPAIITGGDSNDGLYYDVNKNIFGVLCKKVGDIIVLSTKIDDADNVMPYEDAHMYNVKSAKVWIYDEENEQVITQGSIDDLNDAVYANDPNARVFVNSSTGTVRDLFIVKTQ